MPLLAALRQRVWAGRGERPSTGCAICDGQGRPVCNGRTPGAPTIVSIEIGPEDLAGAERCDIKTCPMIDNPGPLCHVCEVPEPTADPAPGTVDREGLAAVLLEAATAPLDEEVPAEASALCTVADCPKDAGHVGACPNRGLFRCTDEPCEPETLLGAAYTEASLQAAGEDREAHHVACADRERRIAAEARCLALAGENFALRREVRTLSAWQQAAWRQSQRDQAAARDAAASLDSTVHELRPVVAPSEPFHNHADDRHCRPSCPRWDIEG